MGCVGVFGVSLFGVIIAKDLAGIGVAMPKGVDH